MTRSTRIFFAVVLGMMFFPGRGVAQVDNVSTRASDLQNVLVNLKQSVEKLSLDNDQWAARDNAMKAKVLQLQKKLGRLEAQGNLFNKTAAQLWVKNPRRAQQIARLEKEDLDLDILTPRFQVAARRQEEKLKLMKMIDDSRQRQKSLHKEILKFYQ